MIFYEQDEKQIVFLLDEFVTNAIADWNRRNHYHYLQLSCYEQQFGFEPSFQLTLRKRQDSITEIEIEQLYPKTTHGETLKQCFIAQQSCGLLSVLTTDYKFPVLKPPDCNIPTVICLNLSLVRYSHLIHGWQGWTRTTAFSGRYIYGFCDIFSGDGWFEDGWIKDTVTRETLILGYSMPMTLSE